MNNTVENILQEIEVRANSEDADVSIEDAFAGDMYREGVAVIVQNNDTNTIGVLTTHVEEFPDDPICCFGFNGQLYEYAKAEGFSRDNVYSAFPDQVFKKIDEQDFVNFIFEK